MGPEDTTLAFTAQGCEAASWGAASPEQQRGTWGRLAQ